MSKDYSAYQKKVINNYYENRDTIITQKLSEMVSDLWLCENAEKAGKMWAKLQTALLSAGVPTDRVQHICDQRNVELLAGLVKELDAGGIAPKAVKPPETCADKPGQSEAPPRVPATSPGHAAAFDEEQLKRAMTAFKKKIKSTKLDDVSGLGGRYTTRGKESSINAVTAPREFPPAVWQELVKRGRLKSVGQGMYQMP
ncbi:MAG: hypothetical protein WC058_10855 [Phycisphaeraceae bacterium]